MTESMQWRDIVISEDWSPKIGGAHAWLESVYTLWNAPVCVHTSAIPEGGSGQQGQRVEHKGNLTLQRHLIPVTDVGFRSRGIFDLLKNAQTVRASHAHECIRIHCKAHFPEGLVATFVKLTRRLTTKVIVYAHGEEINVARSSRLYTIFARWVYGRADVVIANSINTLEMVKSLCPDANVVVVHPGVDFSRYSRKSADRSRIRMELGFSDEETLVFSIGRLEPRKNFLAVYDAIKALRDEGLRVKFILAGSGEQENLIMERARADDASSWFSFKGPITEDEKAMYFAAADVFAMPSIQIGPMIEGFGIVFLEAGAAGVASISGDNGGQIEAVLHDKTGLNVDGASNDDLLGAIRRLVTDSDCRARLSKEASAFAAQHDRSTVMHRVQQLVAHGWRSLPEVIPPKNRGPEK